MFREALKNNRGVSLVLLALSVVVIFGFAALAVDLGHLYNVKDQLQVAADAAALSGAAELGSSSDTTQTAARQAAQRIALKNAADVAYKSGIPTASEGQPIPVLLDANNDIEVGNWNGTAFTAGATPVNAVHVFARRTGANTSQPRAQNWFARVFALLPGGVGYDFSSISAEAIAAKGKVDIVPIIVNEYWNEDPKHAPGSPYGQSYPQSFMRSVNANGSTNALGGKTFAILGTNANGNQSSFNINSFVDILLRSRFHDGRITDPSGTTWFTVNDSSVSGSCSPSCLSNLTPVVGDPGTVNPDKYDANFLYLFNGIPANVIPPNVVREIIRNPVSAYTNDNYSVANGNDPSNCPFATLAYFDSSGSGPSNKKLNLESDTSNGLRFWEKYPKGSRFMVMVYDGTHTASGAVTVVGYGIIELDGYTNGNFNGDPTSLKTGGVGGKGAGTSYGHAVPHGLAGQDDLYLIQPPLNPVSGRAPDCSFTDIIRQAQSNAGFVHLVGPNLKYGLAPH